MSITRHRVVTLNRGPRKDPVTPAMRSSVLLRDGECVAAKLGFAHTCRDRLGRPHAPFALDVLTIEHVKSELGMGQRAPADMGHMLALCAHVNLMPPSKVMREAFRRYLSEVVR